MYRTGLDRVILVSRTEYVSKQTKENANDRPLSCQEHKLEKKKKTIFCVRVLCILFVCNFIALMQRRMQDFKSAVSKI